MMTTRNHYWVDILFTGKIIKKDIKKIFIIHKICKIPVFRWKKPWFSAFRNGIFSCNDG